MPPCSSLFLNARSCSSNTQTPLPTCSPTHDLSPCPPRASALSPPANPLTYTMVKEKNHTNRNQSYKAHRRGIKKVKPQRYRSLRGVSVLESEREVERERAWLRTRATRAAGYGRRFFLWIGNRVRYRRGAAALPRPRSGGKQQQQHGMVATGLRPHPRARAKHGGRAWQARRQSVAAPRGPSLPWGMPPAHLRTGHRATHANRQQHVVVRWPSHSGCSGYCGPVTSPRATTKARSRRECRLGLACLRSGAPRHQWPSGCQMRSRQRVARAPRGHTRRPSPPRPPPTLRCRRSRISSDLAHLSPPHPVTRFTPQVDPKFLRNARFAAVKNQRKKKNTQ